MNNESLDALFTGLTGMPQEERPSTSAASLHGAARKNKSKDTKEERFCTIVSSDLLHKIRLIASREGLQIKDVVNAAFEKAIKSYERKHGTLEGSVRGDTKTLF